MCKNKLKLNDDKTECKKRSRNYETTININTTKIICEVVQSTPDVRPEGRGNRRHTQPGIPRIAEAR